jgi:hypothetical protein
VGQVVEAHITLVALLELHLRVMREAMGIMSGQTKTLEALVVVALAE